jgi:hypothetical protein
MAVSGKKLAGIGCGVLVLGAVAAAGGLTWYSTQLSREYRKVKASEEVLVAATAPAAAWTPPPGGVPDPARVESFAGVREDLAEWRERLADEDRAFAGRRGGNWFLRAGDASELARVMAGFWLARNEALQAAGMGPGEYEWLYGLVYHGWLGHDAAAGRQESGAADGQSAAQADDGRFERRRGQWSGGIPAEAAGVLEPLRARLEAGWTEETNPVELIFVGEPETDSR